MQHKESECDGHLLRLAKALPDGKDGEMCREFEARPARAARKKV